MSTSMARTAGMRLFAMTAMLTIFMTAICTTCTGIMLTPGLIIADAGQGTTLLDSLCAGHPPPEEVWGLLYLVNGVLCLFVFGRRHEVHSMRWVS
jgi:hypothetical protein